VGHLQIVSLPWQAQISFTLMASPLPGASDEKFCTVLILAKNVTTKFQASGQIQVATTLLDMNFNAYIENNMNILEKEANVYGVGFFGDGATLQKMPFLNILCSSVHKPAACLEIIDYTKHLETGGKKDAKYIASLFLPFIEKFEKQHPNTVDFGTF